MIRSDQLDNEYVLQELLQVARSEEFKTFSDEEKEFTRQCIRNKRFYIQSFYPDSDILDLDISDVINVA